MHQSIFYLSQRKARICRTCSFLAYIDANYQFMLTALTHVIYQNGKDQNERISLI